MNLKYLFVSQNFLGLICQPFHFLFTAILIIVSECVWVILRINQALHLLGILC